MRKIRILTVLDKLGSGGTEQYFLSLFDKIDRSKFEFFVAYCEDGNLLDEFRQRGVGLFKTPPMDVKGLIKNKRTLDLFYSFIKESKIDLIQTNFFASALWSGMAAQRVGLPRIRTIWASLADRGLSERFFSKRFFRRFYNDLADVFLCLLNSSREELITKCHVREEKIRLVNLGIDTDRFKPGKKNNGLVRELGLDGASYAVGMVSGLHRVKRPDLFLKAIPFVKRKIKKARFIIIGDGYLKKNLLKSALDLDIADTVLFTGYRTDVDELLRLFDVSVMPALNQLGGLSILESLATGVPVVSSKCNGQRDLIEDTFNGRLFKPGDPVSLADAIVDVLGSKEKLEQMKLNSRFSVESKFDFKEHVDRMERLYSGLLE